MNHNESDNGGEKPAITKKGERTKVLENSTKSAQKTKFNREVAALPPIINVTSGNSERNPMAAAAQPNLATVTKTEKSKIKPKPKIQKKEVLLNSQSDEPDSLEGGE